MHTCILVKPSTVFPEFRLTRPVVLITAGEEVPIVLITQPQTTAKTRPTTPTTTQPFGVALMVYQPSLNDQESTYMGRFASVSSLIKE